MPPFTEPQLDPIALQVLKRNVVFHIVYFLPGTSAATAANYGNMFVADRAYEVVGASEVHRAVGTDMGAVTLNIEKLEPGEAPGSGNNLLSTAFNLKSTADTPVHGTLISSRRELLLKRGDRLVAVDAGTLTAVADVCVTIYLKEL